MLFAHLATAGRGYGHITPAIVGLAAAVIAFALVLAARSGRSASATAPTGA
jgi:hypothetical protein